MKNFKDCNTKRKIQRVHGVFHLQQSRNTLIPSHSITTCQSPHLDRFSRMSKHNYILKSGATGVSKRKWTKKSSNISYFLFDFLLLIFCACVFFIPWLYFMYVKQNVQLSCKVTKEIISDSISFIQTCGFLNMKKTLNISSKTKKKPVQK